MKQNCILMRAFFQNVSFGQVVTCIQYFIEFISYQICWPNAFFFFYPLTFSEIILSFIIITLFKFCWGKKNKKQKNAFQINKQQVPTVTTCLLLHIAWHNMSCHRNKLICMLSQKVSVCWLIVPYFLGNNSDNVDSKVCVYAETDL